jgi:hypothetical protein
VEELTLLGISLKIMIRQILLSRFDGARHQIFDGDVISHANREIGLMHLACLPDPFLERKLWCSDFEIFEHSTYQYSLNHPRWLGDP